MFKRINESFKEKINKPLIITAFISLLLILIWIVLFKGIGIEILYNSKKGIRGQILVNIDKNIIDRFMFQFDYVFHINSLIRDIIPNIIIFVPFGFLLSILNKNKFGINLLITFCISLFFELFELITGIGGITYIDLLTNLIGFIIGFGIYEIINTIIRKESTYNCLINYILIIFIVFALPLIIYGYVEVILNFDIFIPCFSKENYINLFNITNTILIKG